MTNEEFEKMIKPNIKNIMMNSMAVIGSVIFFFIVSTTVVALFFGISVMQKYLKQNNSCVVESKNVSSHST